MTDTKRCKDCIYSARLTIYGIICDYMGIVGHKRPCLPGKDCTVRKTGEKARARPDIWLGKQRKWNTAKAEAMRAQGMTYPAIAKELGTTQAAVKSYFKQKRKAKEVTR